LDKNQLHLNHPCGQSNAHLSRIFSGRFGLVDLRESYLVRRQFELVSLHCTLLTRRFTYTSSVLSCASDIQAMDT